MLAGGPDRYADGRGADVPSSAAPLALVRLGRQHADFVHSLFRDPRVGGQLVDPTVLAAPIGARAFCAASPGLTGEHRFAVTRAGATGPIGVGMVGSPPARGPATIGYALLPGEWGRGHGSALVRALVAFGFEELAASRVFAFVKPTNRASQRVLEKADFRLVARSVRAGPGGAPIDTCRHVLAHGDWRPRGPHPTVRRREQRAGEGPD